MEDAKRESKASAFDGIGTRKLVKYFVAWKAILLVVACASPGPGYDTSTQILFEQDEQPVTSLLTRGIEHLVLRLTRWDGIYFASNSAHGYVNEQNWAFSWALARCTSFISRVIFSSLPLPAIVKHALVGILISTISHLLAVVATYYLTYNLLLLQSPDATKRRVAFLASCLHIISPAGLFLSAPYGESTFAMFNFAGSLSYVLATQAKLNHELPIRSRLEPTQQTTRVVLFTLASGLCLALATMMRSNGILSGLVFALDAISAIRHPKALVRDAEKLTSLAATLCAGVLVGIGFAAPQAVAYLEYCTGGDARPWCSNLLPSIYSWVQSHYWGVGFLRYWTLNNAPLFVLAGPMLVVLISTAFIASQGQQWSPLWSARGPTKDDSKAGPHHSAFEEKVYNHVMPRLALQQLILALMATASFHVQIINRISSGYPVWYIVLASAICSSSSPSQRPRGKWPRQLIRDLSFLGGERSLRWTVRGMVMYAVVQGGLYASFLPPA